MFDSGCTTNELPIRLHPFRDRLYPPPAACIYTVETMLTAEEIKMAAAKLPTLPGREQRERVRSIRAAHPDGISHNKPLTRFPVGLEHRGDPRSWPCNTIEKGRVLVEGGEMVDASDQRLAEEAMALLETDFADFD